MAAPDDGVMPDGAMPGGDAAPGNVLLITADQCRADAPSLVATPNLSRLAAAGTTFTQHYGQAAPCGPARASLLTGRYLMNHRSVRNGTPLADHFATLPRELRRAGYDPALIGYTDTSVDPRLVRRGDPLLSTYEGVMAGFSPSLVLTEEPLAWLADLKARGFDGPLTYPAIFGPRPGTRTTAHYDSTISDTAFMVEAARRWIEVRGDRPWALHLSLLKPHPPWVVPPPYDRLVDPADVAMPVRAASPAAEAERHPLLAHLLEHVAAAKYFIDTPGPASALSEADIRHSRAAYASLLAEVDAGLGRILDTLDRSGQADRTLVVFTSDHGEMLGEHHLFGKDGFFDSAFHIPLIIRDPRRPAPEGGRRVTAFSEAVDVMASILDWLGQPVPAEVDGRSLLPFLAGRPPDRWRDAVMWEYDFRDVRQRLAETRFGLTPDQCCLAVIRDRRTKYVHFAGLPPLLFALDEDPHEQVDRAGDAGMAARRLDMMDRLLTHRLLHAERSLTNQSVGPGGLVEWAGPRVS